MNNEKLKIQIGNLIWERRKRKKLTQYQLADLSGVSRNAILKIESGQQIPELETILRLREVLRFNLNLIVCFAKDATR